MQLRRFLKYLNVGIGVALAGLLFCGYWFAYRPLPQTAGAVAAPIEARATVSRDSLGVPHISAGSVQDALFLQGFVTAQDRLWQMDALRRLAAGELAEVIGPSMLESDRRMRRLRLRRIAENYYGSIPPKDRAALAAYARGVNYFLETHRDRLPLEFSLLGYDPRPWTVVDSMLAGLEMVNRLTRSWRVELERRTLLTGGDPAKVNLLFPVRAGGEAQPGSNAWVISGNHTASGRPLLANDPHLEFSLPSPWYTVHLRAPGLNVIGVSLPGLPCVIIGHNERIAWGITSLPFDTQDLYIEKFDPRTGRYLYRGAMEQAQPEPETIRVKGQRPVQQITWVTRHGPIFLSEGDEYLALRWTTATEFQFPLLELDQAGDWDQFNRALSRLAGPASNFVYADKDGNIGYHAAGKLPIRESFDGDIPVDGSSGDREWKGFIPFEQLPSVYNPPSGVIVSANQNPFPENYPYRVSGAFAPPYRERRILTLLSSKEAWRPAAMLGIETDVYSSFSHFLARQVVAAYDRRRMKNPALADAVSILRKWDGRMRTGTAAPMIARLLYQHLRKSVAERASPGKGLAYNFLMAPAVVEQLLRSRPEAWFRDYDRLLLRSFVDALEEGRRIQGRDVARWDYGRFNEMTLVNPVAGRLPIVGKYFNIGPVPMSGSPCTVQQLSKRRRLGVSMRMIVDLSDLDRSLHNITIGQSGQVLSRHYKDQWDAYYSGTSFPMQFDKVDAKEVLTFTPAK